MVSSSNIMARLPRAFVVMRLSFIRCEVAGAEAGVCERRAVHSPAPPTRRDTAKRGAPAQPPATEPHPARHRRRG